MCRGFWEDEGGQAEEVCTPRACSGWGPSVMRRAGRRAGRRRVNRRICERSAIPADRARRQAMIRQRAGKSWACARTGALSGAMLARGLVHARRWAFSRKKCDKRELRQLKKLLNITICESAFAQLEWASQNKLLMSMQKAE